MPKYTCPECDKNNLEITPEEGALLDALVKTGVRCVPQYCESKEQADGSWDYKHVDLHIPLGRLHIEVDSKSHLLDPNNIYADIERDYWSGRDYGVDVIHIPNELILKNGQPTRELPNLAQSICDAVIRRFLADYCSKDKDDSEETQLDFEALMKVDDSAELQKIFNLITEVDELAEQFLKRKQLDGKRVLKKTDSFFAKAKSFWPRWSDKV